MNGVLPDILELHPHERAALKRIPMGQGLLAAFDTARQEEELRELHERHGLDNHPVLSPREQDDNNRNKAFRDGTPTETNSMGGRRVETGTPLEDRPDGGEKKRTSTYGLLLFRQINDGIAATAELVAELNRQADEYARLASEALANLDQIDAGLRAADDVIDAYGNYQLTGELDRDAAITALRNRNIDVADNLSDRELIDLLERDARKALEDQIRLARDHERQQRLLEFYQRQEELTRQRARDLEQKRQELIADPALSPDERNRKLNNLYDEYSHEEIVEYAATGNNVDLDEANQALSAADAARNRSAVANDPGKPAGANTAAAIDSLLDEDLTADPAAQTQQQPANNIASAAPPPLKFAA